MSSGGKSRSQINQSVNLAEAENVLSGLASVYFSNTAAAQLLAGKYLKDKKEAQVEQRLTIEARYRTLVEQIPAVVFMAFLDEGVGEAYVSPQIESLLGFSQEEWLNDPVRWYRHIHPEDKLRWSIEAAQMFLSGQSLRSIYRVIARDGRVVWFHCEAKMVRREDGRPWFIHGVGFDISELKRAEEVIQKAHDELEIRVQQRTAELARTNGELQVEIVERRRAEEALAQQSQELVRSNQELEQFAYVASHDLKEPLRMMSSFAELLSKRYKGQLDADADEFIEYIVDGATRMQRLIEDLLTYSRVGTKGKPLEPTDCAFVVATACRNLQSVIEESGALININSLPTVLGDETQLIQLFQNLLGNAIKFRAERPVRIEVGARFANNEWLFWVRDNGIGLEPQYADRVFLIFQRLHNRTEYPGTGIGLAICKKIVERHGGIIWVESEPNQGSTFYFQLPSIQPREAER